MGCICQTFKKKIETSLQHTSDLVVQGSDGLDLKKADKTVPLFNFQGMTVDAKIVYCYDGDSCHIVFPFQNELKRFVIRMEGYDCPEMKPRKAGRTQESLNKEKASAQKAKERFEQLVSNQVLKVQLGGFDKYGRILGKIYLNSGECVNDIMIKEGYAKVYDGGTKQ